MGFKAVPNEPQLDSTASTLSDYFIALSNASGNLISNLKLQKLVYYSQAWHLAFFKEPFFNGTFKAWVHGPVLPELYFKYKQFGWKPIEKSIPEAMLDEIEEKHFTEDQFHAVSLVVEEYFGLTAYQLEKLTHNEDPWILARKGLPSDAVSKEPISNNSMIEYYSQFISE